MKKKSSFIDHPDFHDSQKREEILAFEITEDQYDPKYANSNRLEYYTAFTGKPILRKEALVKAFLKFNLLRKLQSDGLLCGQEVDRWRQTIIDHNLRMIPFALKNFADRDDYMSIGYIALSNAVNNFDYNLGYAFNTYAATSIFRTCLRYRNDDMKYQFTPLPEGRTPAVYDTYKDVDTSDTSDYVLSIVDTHPDPLERDIVMRFFGMGDYKVHKLREIGAIYKLSPERIRQLKERGLQRLKSRMDNRPLQVECI